MSLIDSRVNWVIRIGRGGESTKSEFDDWLDREGPEQANGGMQVNRNARRCHRRQ
jgi:hypothetical protein